MNADGSGAHPITPTPARNVEESTPAWSPDGHRLVFSRIRLGPKTLTARIVVADDNGHNARILVGETARRIVSLDSPVWAPDGARVLFTRTTLDKHAFFRPTLQVVNADGTGRRTLAPNASGGSWSPDGERIAFVSVRDRNGDECGSDECSYDGEIYVMNTNGSTLHRLTVSKADDEAPAWSGDGQRIAFQSDRNFPDGQSPEVYSVKPDGTCLTWLTNGTPGSGYPAWRPGSGSSGPGACGATQRPPLVETDVKRATRFHRYPLYWLGRVSARGLLVGDVSREFGFFFVDYDDCGRYYPSECPGLVGLEERRTCRSHPFLDLSRRPRMFRRRGGDLHGWRRDPSLHRSPTRPRRCGVRADPGAWASACRWHAAACALTEPALALAASDLGGSAQARKRQGRRARAWDLPRRGQAPRGVVAAAPVGGTRGSTPLSR